MKNFIYRILLLINVLVIVPMLLGYLSVYVNPEKVWWLAMFGLGYPYLLVINVLFAVFWMYKKRWAFLYSLLVILIGWSFLGRTFQLVVSNSEHVSGSPFNLLSYNVRYFDKFNWTDDLETPAKIGRFLEEKNADIICLQEISSNNRIQVKRHPQLKSVVKGNRYFADFAKSPKGYKATGMITISKFPIVGKGTIQFDNSSNLAIYTDHKINTDTLRVFNVHLQSIHLDIREYSMFDSLNLKNREQNLREAEDILGHLHRGFVRRAEQALLVNEAIEKSPHPVVVCGDFNDSPVSYAYQKIRGNLNDAFIESGAGISNTYRGKFPSFRIDYILHSERLHSSKYEKHKVKLSDHYPVSCQFTVD